jgi:polyisoprenoid-binding protein YceI
MQAQKQDSVGHSQSVWRLDKTHTTVEFTAKKLFFFSVKGCLKEFDGTIVLDDGAIEKSSVEASIAASSVDTGNRKRDSQLCEMFLEASKYPKIEFRSEKVGPGKDRDMLNINGALTIRDKSKQVLLEVTEIDRSRSPNGEEVIYYVAQTEIDRFDFGINQWRGLIGPKLKVVINVQANRI